MQSFLFFSCDLHVSKGGSWFEALQAETVESGDKHRDVTDSLLPRRIRDLQQKTFFRKRCIFCEVSFGKINAKDVELFRNGSVHEFYHLKALINLELVNSSVVEKKKDLYEQNLRKTSMERQTSLLL